MAQRLELKLKQQLSLSPQLQQAIKLLQLGRLELRDYIQDVLDSNPLLEQEGEEESIPESISSEELPTPEQLDEVSADEWLKSNDLPSQSSPDNRDYILDSHTDAGESLQDHLLWQINLTSFSAVDSAIANAIVFALDDDGYLADSIDEIRQSLLPELAVDEAEINAVLRRIQRMEPVGVACTGAAECIQVQLSVLPKDTAGRTVATVISRDFLHLLAAGNRDELSMQMAVSAEKIDQAISLIHSLEPRPGSRYDNRKDEYIVPDVYFLPDGKGWRVSLNPDNEPRLHLNSYYISLLRSEGKKESEYLQGHLRDARWLINSLLLRNRSIMLVAEAIAKHQAAFLNKGEEFMQPLVLREIAAETGLHESTVSRATTSKYALTPRGIFELKYFFSSHVKTLNGMTVSAVVVKALIAKFIQAEATGKPLSDQKLANKLYDQGIHIARRTVAKYREAIGLGSSSQRRVKTAKPQKL